MKKRNGKNKSKVRRVLALTLALAMSMSVPAYASESSVSSRHITTGVNSSNQFVYDGNNTDTTISNRLIRKDTTSLCFIMNGIVKTGAKGIYGNYEGFWYVDDTGFVPTGTTGIVKLKTTDPVDDSEWYYVENGKVAFTYNGLVKDSDGSWYYVRYGQVDFDYVGFVDNENGKWWVGGTGEMPSETDFESTTTVNYAGRVNFSVSGIIGVEYLTNTLYYYVLGGAVQESVNEVVKYNGTWYAVNGGVVDTDGYNNTGEDICKNANGWWYIKDGKVDFSYNGLATNANGTFVIEGGAVNFNYNGTYTWNGKTYNIVAGAVVS